MFDFFFTLCKFNFSQFVQVRSTSNILGHVIGKLWYLHVEWILIELHHDCDIGTLFLDQVESRRKSTDWSIW